MNTNYARRNIVYSLEQVFQLNLLDAPCLLVHIPASGRHPIQISHVTIEELLSVGDLKNSKWEYQYTTNEWIPVFYCLNSEEVIKDLIVKEDTSEWASEGDLLISPIGFERK